MTTRPNYDGSQACPVLSPLVQIGPVLDGVLEGLVRPHGVGGPGVQDQVAEERLVEGGWILNIYIINYY